MKEVHVMAIIKLCKYSVDCLFSTAFLTSVPNNSLSVSYSLLLDMAVLAGAKPEKCMAKYGSLPLKSSYYQEMSLRILLMTVDSAANRHGRYIEPWISLSVSTLHFFEQPLVLS